MKKYYKLILLALASPMLTFAQAPVEDLHNAPQVRAGVSPLFMNDVVVAPSALRETGTSISVAYNGWVYVSTGVETMDSDSSGCIVRMSRDNGYTWTPCVSFLYAGVDYLAPEIEVAGTDTTNLALFITSAWYDSSSGTSDVWVDKYYARNGSFISEVYNESFYYPVRDIDIASDYRYPAQFASPYSVGLLYSHYGTTDSIIFVSSGDGGTTWGNRQGVAGTIACYGNVSLAFGVSSNWYFGRYFAAWEERSSFSGTTIGHIKTAHCTTTFNGTWSSVYCVDSSDAALSGIVRRPRIACQYNSTVNNDSNGVTVLIQFERAYAGDTADCDIIGLYSKSQPAGNSWNRYDIENNTAQTLQPDIAYDPAYNNFLLTYYNRTGGTMCYKVHDYNMIVPSTWAVITNNYCDQPNTLKDPFPRIAINPALTQAAFSWTRQTGTPSRGQAMYDAEYMTTATEEPVAVTGILVYPNPANQQFNIELALQEEMPVRIGLYDLNGRLVSSVAEQTFGAGNQLLRVPTADLPNGIYMLTVFTGNNVNSQRIVVAH